MVHLLLRCSLHREENISISFMQCSHEELSFFKGILFFFMEKILCHAKLHRVICFVFPKCQVCQSTSLVMKSALVPSAAGCCRFPALSWFVVIWVLPGQLAPLHNGGSAQLWTALSCLSASQLELSRAAEIRQTRALLSSSAHGWVWVGSVGSVVPRCPTPCFELHRLC